MAVVIRPSLHRSWNNKLYGRSSGVIYFKNCKFILVAAKIVEVILGIAASPFHCFLRSHLQQLIRAEKASILYSQENVIRICKLRGTNISFPNPSNVQQNMSIATFYNAGGTNAHSLLLFISGIMIGPLSINLVVHVISWMPPKSKRPIWSIGAKGILAASEVFNQEKFFTSAYSTLTSATMTIVISVDSKELNTSLSTRRKSIHKSLLADAKNICFEFRMANVGKIFWLPGTFDLVNPSTNTYIPF